MPPLIVTHPNEVRGPIEETHNALRDAREKQYVDDKAALEADFHADLATLRTNKETALRAAGLNADGGVPDTYPRPYFHGQPQITGTPAVGQTLTCVPGTIIDDDSLAYQWLQDGVAIPTATNSTRVLQVSDEGMYISCRVTATNEHGDTVRVSEVVGPIAA